MTKYEHFKFVENLRNIFFFVYNIKMDISQAIFEIKKICVYQSCLKKKNFSSNFVREFCNFIKYLVIKKKKETLIFMAHKHA